MRDTLKDKKRIVIKVGSSVLVDPMGRLSSERCGALVADIAEVRRKKIQVVLVSSGAIAAGMDRLGIKKKPHWIPLKQAIAAAGQTALMHEYEKAFVGHGLKVAQILLTREDLSNRQRFLNARHTLYELMKMNIIPVINENDTVSVHEIQVGDNDNLAALVTNVAEADLMINLSDIDGVYEADPQVDPSAKRIPLIEEIDSLMKSRASDSLRLGGTGGMATKLAAAEKAQRFGVATIIANGREKNVIQRILAGEELGTLILPKGGRDRLTAKKYWMAYSLHPVGIIVVDEGARRALIDQGKSLLPSGVKSFEGNFHQGDPIDLKVEGGEPFARGLTSYSSAELDRIKGHKTSEIEAILGYKYFDEVIHRNDLVLL